MRIQSFTVEGLLGQFNYTVACQLEAVATIVHAPNGCGKTTLLCLINAVFSFDLLAISRTLFDRLLISFTDGSRLIVLIETRKTKGESGPADFLVFKVDRPGERGSSYSLPRAQIEQFMVRMEKREYVPWIYLADGTKWVDERTGAVLSVRDLLREYGHVLPRSFEPPPEWLVEFLASVSVVLISTRRLDSVTRHGSNDYASSFRSGRATESRPAVEKHSEEIRLEIENVLSQFLMLSQKLDRQFPLRLVEALSTTASAPSADKLAEELKEIEEKYTRVVEAGLLDPETVAAPEPLHQKEVIRKVLSLYVVDQREKLQIFDELLVKIETLKRVLNSRYSGKTLGVSYDTGYFITTTRGSKLKLSQLSSGEQHELVLFHRLLFNVKQDTLVLIDEPEISLHVAWQTSFLSDLEEVRGSQGVHFLMATHSPSIIADRWDLAVCLGEEDEEGDE